MHCLPVSDICVSTKCARATPLTEALHNSASKVIGDQNMQRKDF